MWLLWLILVIAAFFDSTYWWILVGIGVLAICKWAIDQLPKESAWIDKQSEGVTWSDNEAEFNPFEQPVPTVARDATGSASSLAPTATRKASGLTARNGHGPTSSRTGNR